MRRQICWVEDAGDDVTREIRVSFSGARQIKWQFKRSDEEKWNYDLTPCKGDWETLLRKAEARYTRRRMPLKNLDLVRENSNFAK